MYTSCFVNFIYPALVHVDDKDNVISETGNPVHSRHGYDETKQVINDCVQELIEKCFLRHVLNRLQLVVDIQLRRHLDEPEHIDTTYQSIKHKHEPGFV